MKEYAEKNPPKEGQEEDHNAPRPYSETKVVDDLAKGSPAAQATNTLSAQTVQVAGTTGLNYWVSYGALLLAAVSLGLQLKDKLGKSQ